MSLKSAVQRFLSDETGAVTVDFVVFWGGSMLMAYTVVGDVSHGVINVAGGISGALEEIAATNLSLEEVTGIATTRAPAGSGDDNGSDASNTDTSGSESDGSQDSGSTDTGSGESDSGTSGSGNPGNDKDVGNAGENPNGSDNWGSGSNGMSDGDKDNSGKKDKSDKK